MGKRKRTAAEVAADKLRTGRPRKAAREKQSERITVYLTPSERRQFERMAKKEGISLAELVMRPWREEE